MRLAFALGFAVATLFGCAHPPEIEPPPSGSSAAVGVVSAAPREAHEMTSDTAASATTAAPSSAATFGAPSASATAPGKRSYVVAAIGDSLTDPKSGGGGYLTFLQGKCPASRFDSWGKGGNMVNQMRARFARDVLGEGGDGTRPRYSHVIVLGGIADVGSNETAGRTVAKIQGDLGAMYRMAHDRGAVVIALTIPPWGKYTTYDDEKHRMMLEMNAWLRGVPEPVDHVVDVFPKLVCDGRDLCAQYVSDAIHWNKKAHELVGAMLFEQLFSDCA